MYHSTVRTIRNSEGNAVIGLIKSILQTLMMVVVFWIMLSLLGARAMAVRGDYFIYLLSGIFTFMCHIKTIQAVSGAQGPNSPLMMHTPMNSLVSIFSSAISVLYTQVLALLVLLLVYHTAVGTVQIDQPAKAAGMVFLAWYSGIGIGYVFLALRPWIPGIVAGVKPIYIRLNMFASGKMVVANSLPFSMLPIFTWNPLFHVIDQARGFIFINYVPHNSNWEYAFWLSTGLIVVGFIGEGYARQKLSVGWASKT